VREPFLSGSQWGSQNDFLEYFPDLLGFLRRWLYLRAKLEKLMEKGEILTENFLPFFSDRQRADPQDRETCGKKEKTCHLSPITCHLKNRRMFGKP